MCRAKDSVRERLDAQSEVASQQPANSLLGNVGLAVAAIGALALGYFLRPKPEEVDGTIAGGAEASPAPTGEPISSQPDSEPGPTVAAPTVDHNAFWDAAWGRATVGMQSRLNEMHHFPTGQDDPRKTDPRIKSLQDG